MTEAGFTQLITLLGVVGTGVGTVLLQIYRENRNHRWEHEERERVAEALAQKVEDDIRAADITRWQIKRAVEKIQPAVEAVGVKADAAYNEANHVSEKFDKVHSQISDLNKQLIKQNDDSAAAAQAPMKVEVINAPLPVTVQDPR